MNKENKKMAQERRAQLRDKQERRKKIMDFLGLWVPVVLIVVVVIVLIVAIATSGASGDDGDDGFTYFDEDGNEVTISDMSEVDGDDSDSDDLTLDETDGRVVEDGDIVNIDYVGRVDGVPFEGGDTKGMGADLEIGSHYYINGFEEAIIGHKVGETFDLTVTFPDPYENNPAMSGKEAVFTTTINGVYD